MTERQTPEQIAEDCLLTNDDPYLNDSWYLPVDLKDRITRAIREAEDGAYERAAKIAHKYQDAKIFKESSVYHAHCIEREIRREAKSLKSTDTKT